MHAFDLLSDNMFFVGLCEILSEIKFTKGQVTQFFFSLIHYLKSIQSHIR